MRMTLGQLVITVGILAPACVGQGLFDQLNFRDPQLAGFGLYGVSIYAGRAWYGRTEAVPIPSNTNYGASFSVGWQHHQTDTNASIFYSGNYGGLVQYPQFNGYNQSVSGALSHKIGEKWSASLSASAQDYSLAQSLFQPSSIGVTSQILAEFNDFAASYGVGQFTTSQVQSLFNSFVLDSAVRSGLLGGRALSYGGQASVNYAYSPNLQFHVSGFGAGGQRLSGSGETANQPNYAMPAREGVDAGMSYMHGFSPRTQVGLSVDENFIHNPYQEASISSTTGSFARKMGSRWFLRMYGGGSYTHYPHQPSVQGNTLQGIGGGSIGFQMLTYTLVATYDRIAAYSALGFSVGTITNLGANWIWHRHGSRFSVTSGFNQEQQRNTGLLSISGWQATAGISESLGTQMALSANYSYLDSTADYPTGAYRIKTSGVQASLSWSPRPVRR